MRNSLSSIRIGIATLLSRLARSSVRRFSFLVPVLQLIVDCVELLIPRLQLFLGSLQLLIDALQFSLLDWISSFAW